MKFTPQKREKVLSRCELHEVPKREKFAFDFRVFALRIFQFHNANMITAFRVSHLELHNAKMFRVFQREKFMFISYKIIQTKLNINN